MSECNTGSWSLDQFSSLFPNFSNDNRQSGSRTVTVEFYANSHTGWFATHSWGDAFVGREGVVLNLGVGSTFIRWSDVIKVRMGAWTQTYDFSRPDFLTAPPIWKRLHCA